MEWFPSRPPSYWKSMSHQKQLLDDIAIKLNIKKPSDWGKITLLQFIELGGGSVLTFYYHGSLFKCLQSVYKGSLWKWYHSFLYRCRLEDRVVLKYSPLS